MTRFRYLGVSLFPALDGPFPIVFLLACMVATRTLNLAMPDSFRYGQPALPPRDVGSYGVFASSLLQLLPFSSFLSTTIIIIHRFLPAALVDAEQLHLDNKTHNDGLVSAPVAFFSFLGN